ncbi:S-layer homology domain-containing protein [Alkaliphilus pronyensis]|uniref:S-layer homology domain-containing protein n=1 Tax=Alkaliphilus pronyensis TaxID=1482732 RepID=A0A6I0F5R0_9FIRM|nr:S-layer homology domain-containing protein [Alkaliphilus pronyensis]KAB3531884.1 S-layer homology domain-containing protein [Alkaliphilus pronyensis]
MFKLSKSSLILISVLIILIYSITTVAANTSAPNVEASGNYLRELGLFKGYDDGSLGLERNIIRAEFATLVVRMLGLEEEAKNKMGETIFKDVPSSFWGSGYINVASEEKLI